ncbi:sensor histidine kinase [Phytoactinopolyspora mesophila]|uniref:histidine kinase n=1 Tax=Phytoactinopolyspora mesophila TaxID=2650750 RepID=A0A7K3M9H5_9ACTN|nr:histidine kinase [Phytoactinopolyspora mesophila]NDL59975.1 sensor histidine kinase [Phytoactinopolyspora mesophila]
MNMLDPIRGVRPGPLGGAGLAERLRLTGVSFGYVLAFLPAVPLAVLSLLAVVLGVVGVGFVLAFAVVPATAAVTGVHRRVSGELLDRRVPAAYADTTGVDVWARPLRWVADPARWRDVGFLLFSATGGFLVSVIPPVLLALPIVYLTGLIVDPGPVWVVLFLGALGLGLPVWWLATPALVRARARADHRVLAGSRVAELERRVEQVTETRAAGLDHSAAEIRRIERDLHDGAQARMASVGMTVGLAKKLLASDPEAADALLTEARDTAMASLDDLRSVVRDIHPPVLADRGLTGAIEALAMSIALPVTVAVNVGGRLPDPIESAAYFAVAEGLANTVKHAEATRAYVTGSHDGTRLRLVVGDDGRGGADAAGSGLSGIARRLSAFDGVVGVDSPAGGPTTVTIEIPCPT